MGNIVTFTDNFPVSYSVVQDQPIVGPMGPTPPPLPINLWDSGVYPYKGWTTGASAVHPVALTPRLSDRWTVLGWSISVQGVIWQRQQPAYGRLGALYGGLVLGAQDTWQTVTLQLDDFGLPWVNPYRRPGDTTMISKLWDGNTDPPWPVMQQQDDPAKVPISTSFSLPVPLKLRSGERFSIGLWLSPSLLVNTDLGVFGATYSVTYQDDTEAVGGFQPGW